MGGIKVEIYLRNGATISATMNDQEVQRLTDDFSNFVSSDNPANSGGVYNSTDGGASHSIFVAFEGIEAIVVHGMSAS